MINVIGLGYIGLPTALIFSSIGEEVVGSDQKKELIDMLNSRILPFEESGLFDLFEKSIKNSINFSIEYKKADIFLIAVPTPYNVTTKKIDPGFIITAVNNILKIAENQNIIIIESTISPGTIDYYIRPLIKNFKLTSKKTVHIVHAPERIIPGNMVYELTNNSRTIGADSTEIGEKVARLYRKVTKGVVVVTDIKTAEMTKVVENTFRAVNIAFSNELLKLCNELKMNVHEVIKISNMHPRVNILNPGPGVGGHCIPVDPWFLVGDNPLITKLINQALIINEEMPSYVFDKITRIMEEKNIKSFSRVGLYGLSYKENVDDFRESPSLQLLSIQRARGTDFFQTFDPYIKLSITNNQFFDFDSFLSNIDIIVIMVKHDHLKTNLDKISNKIILDTQNFISNGNRYNL
jgi:UDP-N-acetyl-D-mannosaminuronic acid dehydrogenase